MVILLTYLKCVVACTRVVAVSKVNVISICIDFEDRANRFSVWLDVEHEKTRWVSMTSRFLVWATGKMELSFTKMGKTAVEQIGGCRKILWEVILRESFETWKTVRQEEHNKVSGVLEALGELSVSGKTGWLCQMLLINRVRENWGLIIGFSKNQGHLWPGQEE